jgi:hypothetical protein
VTAHAELSASGSPTWLNCPGSRKAQRPFPNESSPFAEEGTKAHDLAAIALEQQCDAEHVNGEWPEEMIRYVQQYIDYVIAHTTNDSELYVEEKVSFAEWVPNGFGTADAIIIRDNECHVFDLKYGKGIQVYAQDNTQLQLYALGVMNEFAPIHDIRKYVLHIVQPRKITPDPWERTPSQMRQFAAFVAERAALAMEPAAPKVPGDKQCQWCRAKASCPELAAFVEQVIGSEFDDLDELDLSVMNEDRQKQILDAIPLATKLFSAIQKMVFNRLASGGDFPGYKLVAGRSNRVWTPEAEAFLKKELKARAYDKKLIGITKAEKMLGPGPIRDYTHKPEGKPTLAKSDDARETYHGSAEDLFDVES